MSWADVSRGVQGAVQQQLLRRMQEQQLAVQAQESERRALREQQSDLRADRDFAFKTEQFDAGQARLGEQDRLAADDRAFARAGTIAGETPVDSFLPETSASVGMMDRGGRGHLMQPTPELPGMGEDFQGPLNTPGGELPQAAKLGREQGRIHMGTAAQRNTVADNERAAQIAAAAQAQAGRVEDRAVGAEGRAVASAAEAARHNRAMENKSTGGNSAADLANFEAKEQIKAKYAGSRPSVGAERQTLSYYNRAKEATENIEPLEAEIAGKSLAGQARLQMAPNFMQSDTNQSYRQAQRAFTEARLRKESGAAIPAGEYENDARTYFAQPGDGKAVLEQKRKARQVVLDGMKNASGKAYDEFYGQPASKPGTGGGTVKILSIEEVE